MCAKGKRDWHDSSHRLFGCMWKLDKTNSALRKLITSGEIYNNCLITWKVTYVSECIVLFYIASMACTLLHRHHMISPLQG